MASAIRPGAVPEAPPPRVGRRAKPGVFAAEQHLGSGAGVDDLARGLRTLSAYGEPRGLAIRAVRTGGHARRVAAHPPLLHDLLRNASAGRGGWRRWSENARVPTRKPGSSSWRGRGASVGDKYRRRSGFSFATNWRDC